MVWTECPPSPQFLLHLPLPLPAFCILLQVPGLPNTFWKVKQTVPVRDTFQNASCYPHSRGGERAGVLLPGKMLLCSCPGSLCLKHSCLRGGGAPLAHSAYAQSSLRQQALGRGVALLTN